MPGPSLRDPKGPSSMPVPVGLLASKSWVGHQEPAAGLAALSHAANGATHAMQPHLLHLRTVNPHCAQVLESMEGTGLCMGRQPAPRPMPAAKATITHGDSRARADSRLQHQRTDGKGLRMGTSSFAFMGTNAHIVSRVVHPQAKAAAPSAVASAQGGRMVTTQISCSGNKHPWRHVHFWAAPNPSLLARYASVGPSSPCSLSGVCRAGGMVIMQAALSHPNLSTLLDHRVRGQALLPGAAMMLMAQATATQLSAGQTHQLVIHLVHASIPGPMVLTSLASGSLPSLCCSLDVYTGQLRIYSTAPGADALAPQQPGTAARKACKKAQGSTQSSAQPLASTHLSAQVASASAQAWTQSMGHKEQPSAAVAVRTSLVILELHAQRAEGAGSASGLAEGEAEGQSALIESHATEPEARLWGARGNVADASKPGEPPSACAWVCSEHNPSGLSASGSPSSSTGGLGAGVVDSFLQLGQVFLPAGAFPGPGSNNIDADTAGKQATYVPTGFDSLLLMAPAATTPAASSLGKQGYEACVQPRPRPLQSTSQKSPPTNISSDYHLTAPMIKAGADPRGLALSITGMQAKSIVLSREPAAGEAAKAPRATGADVARDVAYTVQWMVDSFGIKKGELEGTSRLAAAHPVLSVLHQQGNASVPPTLPVATLLAALQRCMAFGKTRGLQLLSSSMVQPGVAALQGLLRTAAQEGCPSAVICREDDLGSCALAAPTGLAAEAPPCLAFNQNESVGNDMPDVYGNVVGIMKTIPRLVACPPAHQADAFSPYKLLPLPRGSLSSLLPTRFTASFSSMPQHKQQVVSVRAVGLNFRDVLNVLGMYPGDPGDPGSDFAGIVESGPVFQAGTPVFGLATGCLASHVVSHSDTLAPLPPNLTFEEGSSCPTILATVDAVLGCATGMQPGEVLMLPAGAGGVGLAAIQLVHALGATAIATAGSTLKRALLRNQGAQHVSGSRDTAYVEELTVPHPGGAHVVLNTLTSPGMVSSAAAMLRAGGRFVEIGKRDITSVGRMAQERPDVAYGLLAIDFLPPSVLGMLLRRVSSRLASGKLRPIQSITYSMGSVSSALRRLSQARHVGKVVVGCGVAPSALNLNSSTLPPCETMLHGRVAISGGLGSLGLLIAQWLAQQGVQHILLLARSARTTSAASPHLSQLWQGHTQATVSACDAGCAEDVCAALAPPSHHQHLPPLIAVLHAGGVLADATLCNQSLAGLRKVMGAKVSALPYLLGAAQLQPGAHHVLFSSVASLLGSPGQANYSAANAALDAAASSMEAMGLPARSIQWGPWKTGGMAAETAKKNEAAGIGALAPDLGLQALQAALAAASASLLPSPCLTAASPFDWAALVGQLKAAGRTASSLLAAVAPEAPTTSAAKGLRVAGKAPKPKKAQKRQHEVEAPSGPSHNDIQSVVSSAVTRIVGSSVPLDAPLMSAGLDSLGAVELRNSLEGSLQMQLPGTLVFDFPSVSAIAEYVAGNMGPAQAQAQSDLADSDDDDQELFEADSCSVDASPRYLAAAGRAQGLHMPSVHLAAKQQKKQQGYAAAIVAASHRTPQDVMMHPRGAQDTIAAVPEQRWDAELQLTSDVPARFGAWLLGKGSTGDGGSGAGPELHPKSAMRGDATHFDAIAFNMPASEASMLDPQQRILLELAAEVLNSPACSSTSTLGQHVLNAGMYVGISTPDYAEIKRAHTPIGVYSATGSALSVAAGRVSFVFGLHGPSAAIDTACSSSLVATHMALACMGGGGDEKGASKLALASGTKVILTPTLSAMFQRAGMLAPDGRCKTLDASADGYVRAEAAAMIALCPPSVAEEREGTPVLGLIISSSVNQDGRSSALTAPNGPAQGEVMRKALASCGLQPHTVTGLQLHGTGTSLGDSIELGAAAATLRKAAQAQVYANATKPSVTPLRVASDKSASGHTEPSAGLVGLLNALRATHEQAAQPLMHLTNLNPYLAPVIESAGAMILPRQRMALSQQSTGKADIQGGGVTGCSSFAFQGTNSHVLLQPPPLSSPHADPAPFLPQHFTPCAATCSSNTTTAPPRKDAKQAPTHVLWERHYLSVVSPTHSMLRSFVPLPKAPTVGRGSGGWIGFEASITHPSVAWLMDHVVSGKALLPGSALLELASAAGMTTLATPGPAKSNSSKPNAINHHHLALCDVSLNAPLTIPNPASALGVHHTLIMLHPASGTFEITSPPQHAKAAAVQHVQGSMERVSTSSLASSTAEVIIASTAVIKARAKKGQSQKATTTAEAARARCPHPHNSTHLYSSLRSIGLEYGTSFRLLESVHASEVAANQLTSPVAGLATARVTPKHSSHGCNFAVNPAVLDNAFQLGAMAPSKTGSQALGKPPQSQVYVPASVKLFMLDCGCMGNLGHGQDRPTNGSLFASAMDGVTPTTQLPSSTPNAMLRHISLTEVTPTPCNLGSTKDAAATYGPLVTVHGLESRLLRSAAGGGAPGGVQKRDAAKDGVSAAGGGAGAEDQDVLYEVDWLAETPTVPLDHSALVAVSAPAAAAAASMSCVQFSKAAQPGASPSPASGIVSAVAFALMAVNGPLLAKADIGLTTVADQHLPASDASRVLAGAGLHALMRTLMQESGGSIQVQTERVDTLRPSPDSSLAKISLTQSTGSSSQLDAYGISKQMGTTFSPRIMRTLHCGSSDRQYKLLPMPRGSLTSLQPRLLIMPQQPNTDSASSSLQVVAVRAVGLNFRDVLNVLGMYPGDPGDPGGDCAGVVVDGGNGGTPYAPGTPVFGLAAGCLGSHVLCSHLSMAPMPSQLSPEQAATCPTVFITADAVLRQAAQMLPGETLLLPAAAGGVGLAALQVAQALGAMAVCTAGSPSKRALLRSLGVQHVSCSRDTAFVEDVAATNSGGVHVVLNTLTSPGMVSSAAALLRAGGRFVEIGKRDVTSVARLAQERPDVNYGFLAMDFMPGAVLQGAMHRLTQGLARGVLRPLPLAAHGLRSVAAALRQLSQARHVGKVVVSAAPHADVSSQAGSGSHGMGGMTSNRSLALQPGMRAVITGGTGSLGTLIAQWLTGSHWRCSVLLLGRTGKLSSSPAQQSLFGINTCASVAVALCDTASAEELQSVLAGSCLPWSARTGPGLHQPPMSLLFHAGGVLADATLKAQTPRGVRKVVGPKVATLSAASSVMGSQPCAGATFFSSIAALLGAPGQANYGAANAALDAAATTWQHTGMPTVSVQWGAWAGSGMAANDASTAARVARMGMAFLQPQQGLQALEGVLGSLTSGAAALTPSPTLTANPFIWPTFLSRLKAPPGSGPGGPFLAEMAAEESTHKQPAKPGAQVMNGAGGAKKWKEGEVEAAVMEAVAGVLGTSDIKKSAPLMESGLDSLGSVELRNTLSVRFATDLPATLTFDYPTPHAITEYIMSISGPAATMEDVSAPEAPIVAISAAERKQALSLTTAITGMGLRFPHGMSSIQRLHAVCSAGGQGANELHSQAPLERFDAEAEYAPPGYKAPSGSTGGHVSSKFGAYVASVHNFDAPAFSIPPTEAAFIDPQTRMLLEESMHAFADSGRSFNDLLGSSVGVFVGCIWSEYGELLAAHQERSSTKRGGNAGSSQIVTGNGLAFMVGRVSYTFGLTGPCIPTNTACSSSLVAAHLAANSISAASQGSADCQAALAAGVNAVLLPRGASAAMTQVSALAPDGRCKAFADDADGYGRGEGFAALVMESMQSHSTDRSTQRVLAVYAGSAVNQDGRSSGLTAPNGPSQTALVKTVLSRAGLVPGSASGAAGEGQQQLVIATHGTGTPLGDPMEVYALTSATSKLGAPGQGTVPMLVTLTANKVVVGHLEGCAGLAGLLSAHLATSTSTTCPPLRLRGMNPNVKSSMEGWAAGGARMPLGPGPAASVSYAGTSSFGMSGVNAHAILTAPPPMPSLDTCSDHSTASLPAVMAPKLRWMRMDMRKLAQLPVGHALLPRILPTIAGKLGTAPPNIEFGVQLGGGPLDSLDPSSMPRLAWLWDHQVGGKALLPGAAYMEMAVAAASCALLPASASSKPGKAQHGGGNKGVLGSGTGACTQLVALEGGAFLAPCVMSMQGLWLQVQLNPVTGTLHINSVSSGKKPGAATTPHFAASLSTTSPQQPSRSMPINHSSAISSASMPQSSCLSADALRARASSPLDVCALYQGLHAAGLQYGPCFRLIRNSACSNAEGSASAEGGKPMAQARLPIVAEHTGMGYHVHPALLDNMLQLGTTVPVSGGATQKGGGAFVPASVGCLMLPASPMDVGTFSLAESGGGAATAHGRTGTQLHVYAQQAASIKSGPGSGAATHRNHWAVLSSNGAEGGGDAGLCIVLRDLEAKCVGGSGSLAKSGGAGRTAVEPQGLEQALYQVEWVAQEPALATALANTPVSVLRMCMGHTASRGMGVHVVTAWALGVLQQACAMPGTSVGMWHSNTSDHPYGALHMPDSGLGGLARAVNAEQSAVSVLGSKDPLEPVPQSTACFEFSSNGGSQPEGYGLVHQGQVLLGPRLIRCAAPTRPPALAAPHQYLPYPARGSLKSLKPQALDVSSEGLASASAAAGGGGLMTLEVHAVGLNFRDVLNVLGMYPGDPGAPGSDCAGVVVNNQAQNGLAPGTPVFGLASGCLGSHVLCSTHTFAPLPPQLTPEQAATCPTVFITADAVLRQCIQLQPGESIMLPAAAGGVGLAGMQVARALGATAVCTAGSPSKRALLRSLGAHYVSGSRDTAFVEELAATNSSGIHAVLNTLTSPGMASSAAALLHAGGRFVEIGKRDVTSVARLAQERPDVNYGFLAMDFMPAAVLGGAMHRLSHDMANGVLRPIPLVSLSLHNVAAALRLLSQARHVGKVVVSSHFGNFPSILNSSRGSAPDMTCSSLSVGVGAVGILGGTGSLGVLVASWLAGAGVLHIALLSRTGKSSAATNGILASGHAAHRAQIMLQQCDGSFSEDAASMVHGVQTKPCHRTAPLKAIMHAGGVLQDATIAGQSLHGLRKVLAPKVSAAAAFGGSDPGNCGSMALQPGAHHVFFSSVASLLGSPGQANYGAANAALDAAAGSWQKAGLPAVSVQWGAWAGGGMAAWDAGTAARVARTGMALLAPSTGLAALASALSSTSGAFAGAPPVLSAVPFLWEHLLPRFRGHPPPVLATMAAEEGGSVAPAADKPTAGATSFAGGALTPEKIAAIVNETACGVLGRDDVGPDEPLMSAGLDSLGAVELRNSLEGSLQVQLPGTLVFDFPSVSAISQFITTTMGATEAAGEDVPRAVPGSGQHDRTGIVAAVTGMCLKDARTSIGLGQVPAGVAVDAISQVPVGHWDVDSLTVNATQDNKLMPPRFGGWLSGAELFDAQMFGLQATEAVLLDPQQRLLLESAHESLTMAAGSVHSPTSVMVGIASAEYNSWVLRRHPLPTSAYSATGGALSVACGRISYLYGFHGTSISVDTACSSSLVAAHLAVISIQSGGPVSSGSAVVGGTGQLLCPEPTAMFQAAGMLAPDGRCKTLDAAADGYVRAEACGTLVLSATTKSDAEAAMGAGPPALAFISSSAVNQDGRSSALTAPNGPAQQAVVRSALASGGMHAGSVRGLQLHGTGTPLGDPIEIGAVAAVLAPSTKAQPDAVTTCLPVLVSAAKSVVGHTEAAAGVVGLCHTVCGLHSALAHPISHLHNVDTHLATALPTAPAMSLPRQQAGAGVKGGVTGCSSFAFQGTNAHCVLTLHPSLATTPGDPAFPDPAHTAAALTKAAINTQKQRLVPWQRHRVWAAPPASVLLNEVLLSSSVQKATTFVCNLRQYSLAFLWQSMLGGLPIAPTAFLLELASTAVHTLLHNPTAITGVGTAAAFTGIVLPSSCVLERQPYAAAELLCVCQQGQVEVRSPPKSMVHLQSRAASVQGPDSSKPCPSGPETKPSAAISVLVGLVVESMASCTAPASESTSSVGALDAPDSHTGSIAGNTEAHSQGVSMDSFTHQYPSYACVSASVGDAANSGQGYACVQDAGVDGRLVHTLDFEAGLQAGAIAHYVALAQAGGYDLANAIGVLSTVGAYLPPPSVATAGHDGGRKMQAQMTASVFSPPAGAQPGVKVGMESGFGTHRAEEVGYLRVGHVALLATDAAVGTTAEPSAEDAARAGEAAAAGPHPLLAMDAKTRTAYLQERVLGEVSIIVGRSVEPEEPLMMAAGVDSLGAMELRSSLTNSLGCTLPTTLLYDHQSPAEIAVFISQALEDQEAKRLEAAGAKAKAKRGAEQSGASGSQQDAPSNLLKMLRPVPVPRPLFLAAPGVANAQSAYFSFSAFLQWSDQPIFVLDKDNDLDMRALAAANAKDMLSVQPPGNGPYILGGHSYGGAVAVEIALLLESWGHEVGLVLVMDTPRPEQVRTMQPEAQEPTDEDSLELMEMILGALGKDAVGLGASTGHPRESEEWKSMTMEQRYAFFAPVWRVMRSENITAEEVGEQIRYVALTVKKGSQVSDMRHHDFTGRRLQGARMMYLRASIRGACDYVNDTRDGEWPHGVCWADLCEELEVIDVPGDHFSILRQGKEDMKLLVATLKRALGAFGWTESVRREPKNLLLQASKARRAESGASPGQGQKLDDYLKEMGVTDEARSRLMNNMREYGSTESDYHSTPIDTAPLSGSDDNEHQRQGSTSDFGRASLSIMSSASRGRSLGGRDDSSMAHCECANAAAQLHTVDPSQPFPYPLFLVLCGGSVPEWARAMPHRPVYAIFLPTHTQCLVSLQSVQDAASALLAVIAASQISGPYAIGGVGQGAVIAHELACQAQDRGEPIAALVCAESEKSAEACHLCKQPWLQMYHSLTDGRPDLDMAEFVQRASLLAPSEQVAYIESLQPSSVSASAWRSAVQERLDFASASLNDEKWEVLDCWCALHDLLMELYHQQEQQQQPQVEGWEGSSESSSVAFVTEPPPSLQTFITQMCGVEEDAKAQMGIVVSYIRSIAPVHQQLQWEVSAATSVWRVSYMHSLIQAYFPLRIIAVPVLVAQHIEGDAAFLGKALPMLQADARVLPDVTEGIDNFLKQHRGAGCAGLLDEGSPTSPFSSTRSVVVHGV